MTIKLNNANLKPHCLVLHCVASMPRIKNAVHRFSKRQRTGEVASRPDHLRLPAGGPRTKLSEINNVMRKLRNAPTPFDDWRSLLTDALRQ